MTSNLMLNRFLSNSTISFIYRSSGGITSLGASSSIVQRDYSKDNSDDTSRHFITKFFLLGFISDFG